VARSVGLAGAVGSRGTPQELGRGHKREVKEVNGDEKNSTVAEHGD
jgi:hypothetical protein